MKKITDKQERFLKFIEKFWADYGYAPSVREIAKGLGLASTSGVKSMMDRLSERGLLRRESGMARTISLSEKHPPRAVSGWEESRYGEECGVPVLGRICAGMPVQTEENIEGYITVSDFLETSSGGFFLIVEGYSMKDRGILPGDYAFIKPHKEISNGQIGAFRVNGEVTLKIFKRTEDSITLLPANEEFPPITVTPEDEFEVIGRFVMLLRLVEKGYDRRFS